MNFNAPVVTMLYAAICGVLLIVLALNIVRLRRSHRVSLGLGEGAALEQLLLAELGGAAFWFLHLLGAAFVAGRMLHAYGLSTVRARSFGRFYGSLSSWTSILVLSGHLLVRSFG